MWFLCLVLVLGSLILLPQPVSAEDDYIVDMNERTNISVTADDTVWGKDGKIITYIVFTKSVTCTNRVTVKGNVRLCLYHGNTLNMTKGITVPKGSKLSIYAQTGEEKLICKAYKLIADDGVQHGSAGIGGEWEAGDYGTIEINGGNIEATGVTAAAGIGGYDAGTGTIIINGGNVWAHGDISAAGIGGGSEGHANITINGGTVEAIGGVGAAGIGGGLLSPKGSVTINGGNVKAYGNRGASGIGAGNRGDGWSVKITGGTVYAKGDREGAGIGGGCHYLQGGDGGDVTITGGSVTTEGAPGAMGIGRASNGSNNGTITLGSGIGLWISSDNKTWKKYDGTTRDRYMKTGELHDLEAHAAKEATCTEEGNIAYWSCKTCGKYFSDEEGMTEITKENTVVPAKGHTPKKETVIENEVKATCTSGGSYDVVTVCADCGTELSRTTKTTAPLGHDWSEPEYVWAEDNSTVTATRACRHDGCGRTETETVDAVKETVKVATCTEDGEAKYTAAFENEAFEKQTKEVAVPAEGYLWTRYPVKYRTTKKATCTEGRTYSYTRVCVLCNEEKWFTDGTTEPLGHAWSTPTYTWSDDYSEVTAKHVCARDDSHVETETVKAEITTTIDADSCEKPGASIYEAKFTKEGFERQRKTVWNIPSHIQQKEPVQKIENEVKPTCTEGGSYDRVTVCAVCGKELSRITETTAPLGHDWGDWEVKKAATCEEAGEETRTCKNDASHTETRVIPATGHDWGKWEETKPATETEEGEEIRICKNDPSHTETRKIPAKTHVHQLVKVEAKAATCTEEGNIEYWICSEGENPCHRYFEDEEGQKEINLEDTVIPALGHSWDEGVQTTAPGCTTDGVMTYTCTVCGETKEETIEKTLHVNEWEDETIQEPSCEMSGYHWHIYRCQTCGEIMTIQLVKEDPTGHDWGEPEYTWADDNKSVTAKRVCKNDSTHEESETVNTTVKVIKPATYTGMGYTKYTAVFTNDAFTTQTRTVADIEKLHPTEPAVKAGDIVKYKKNTYKVTSVNKTTVAFIKAKNAKKVVIPATIQIKGKTYKVTQINARAFKGSKIRTVKIKLGKNKVNKTYVRKYKKIFTKKNAGRKVKVEAKKAR